MERLSIREAAAEVGVSAECVRHWIAGGLLPAVRVGPRLVRIDRDALASIERPYLPEPEEVP
ncbi:excisionase family DNA-binding protein [Mycobacterium syngnathidarum]